MTDDAFAVARHARTGRYVVACGMQVISASLTVPEGRQRRSWTLLAYSARHAAARPAC
ncbi:MAG TPA: hypothetical protein VIY28_08635 [Pseudonocardiaceae bacterium]